MLTCRVQLTRCPRLPVPACPSCLLIPACLSSPARPCLPVPACLSLPARPCLPDPTCLSPPACPACLLVQVLVSRAGRG